MKIADVLSCLVGGAVVYVVAAACTDVASTSSSSGGVPNANAQESDVATETCFRPDGGNSSVAVHDYPGKTREELATVRILVPIGDDTFGIRHFGASHRVDEGAFVGDGIVVVAPCNAGETVTFVLPR